jgi:hypothetical protein
MDNYTTTIAAVQEVYDITLLIRGIVYKVESYDSDAQSIRADLEREYVFLNASKSIFFAHEEARLYYTTLPVHLTNDIKIIFESLRSSLELYSLLAMKHGVSVVEPPVNAKLPRNVAASNEVASRVTPGLKINFQDNLHANLQHLRRSFDPLNWVLFDKDKILGLLSEYSKYTELLRGVVSLILLLTRKNGFFAGWDMAQNPMGLNLSLKQVAERQNRAGGRPYTSFAPLGGNFIDESPHKPFHDYQMVEYDEGLKSGRIQVILEEHRFNMQDGGDRGLSIRERRNEELQPIRTLA